MKPFFRAACALLWLAVIASGCGETTAPQPPASFERPNRIAFLCVDKLDPYNPKLADLKCCTSATTVAADAGATSGCRYPAAYTPYGFVTQSSRGEVAAVDLAARLIVDTRPDIPGPTFVPVGENPIAIAVAPHAPGKTYVANAGSRDISVLPTPSLLSVSVASHEPTARVLVQPSPGEPAGAPFDILISPDEDTLFVTSAQAGFLLSIPIKRCADESQPCPEDGQLDIAAAVRIPLEDSWAKFPSVGSTPIEGEEPYRFECSATGSSPFAQPAGPLPNPSLNPGVPQPAGLAVDAFCEAGEGCTRRLLVADKRQPIIHAIDLDLLKQGMLHEAVLPPIVSGSPTERVAVSPKVPVDTGMTGETQYVYAIDAVDGSVLVTQDGVVREVSHNPGLRRDRLDLGGSLTNGLPVALSLALLTPAFDVHGPADQWIHLSPTAPAANDPLLCFDPSHTGRLASRLRGVFLAVGLSDGSVRIVNVHDMELRACRSCSVGQVQDWTVGRVGYDPYPVVRHESRIGWTLVPSGDTTPVLAPQVTPQFQIDTSFLTVKTDGTTNDPRATGLDCIACPRDEAVSFPPPDEVTTSADGGVSTVSSVDAGTTSVCLTGQGRVCSLADPAVDPFNWEAVYEGVIPGTRGGHGEVVDDTTFETDVDYDPDFCAAGVLGDEDARELHAGDQLQITSALPSDALRATSPQPEWDRESCTALVTVRDQDAAPIAFRIRQASGHRLVLNPQLIISSRKQPALSLKQVAACFAGMPLTFQVHSRESFVVQSSGNIGFQHRVMSNPDTGRCQIDTTKDARHTGRARSGERFDNGSIAFQISPGAYAPLTTLRLLGVSSAPKLMLNANDLGTGTLVRGVMPVDLGYFPGTETLYTIDITIRGMIPLTLDPMSSTVTYDYTVQ